MAHLNMHPYVYVTVWEDLHNTAQTFMQRGRYFYSRLVLLLPPAPCVGDAVFRCESKSTSKRGHN